MISQTEIGNHFQNWSHFKQWQMELLVTDPSTFTTPSNILLLSLSLSLTHTLTCLSYRVLCTLLLFLQLFVCKYFNFSCLNLCKQSSHIKDLNWNTNLDQTYKFLLHIHRLNKTMSKNLVDNSVFLLFYLPLTKWWKLLLRFHSDITKGRVLHI